jgi:hypothetical protein
MPDSPTRSITLFLAVGALSVILNESNPSLPVLGAFLVSVSLVGSQYTDLLSDSIVVRLGLAVPVGLVVPIVNGS